MTFFPLVRKAQGSTVSCPQNWRGKVLENTFSYQEQTYLRVLCFFSPFWLK